MPSMTCSYPSLFFSVYHRHDYDKKEKDKSQLSKKMHLLYTFLFSPHTKEYCYHNDNNHDKSNDESNQSS